MTGDEKPCGGACKNAARRGLLWTAPVWLAVLSTSLGVVYKPYDDFLAGWPGGYAALAALCMFGSSLCMITGFALTKEPAGLLDTARKGVLSALAVAASYLCFSVAALNSADPKGPAWGGAFGLVSALGSFIAALMGAFAKLGWRALGAALNPYKEAPKK